MRRSCGNSARNLWARRGRSIGENSGRQSLPTREKLAQLNAITHPCICAEIRARLAAQRGTVFLDAPLLVQAGLDTLCGEIWQVTAADDIRLGRIQVRDGLDADEARARMQSQAGVRMPTDRLVHTIDNSSDTAALYRQIDRLLAGRTPYENA